MLSLATVIAVLEIIRNIFNGVEMSGEDYLEYALFIGSFLFALFFINFVDFIIRAMDGDSAKR